jgi:hypothetical protein
MILQFSYNFVATENCSEVTNPANGRLEHGMTVQSITLQLGDWNMLDQEEDRNSLER